MSSMIFGCVSNWTNGAVHFLCFGWLDGQLGSFSAHIYYIFYRQQTGTFKKLKCFNHRLTWSSSMISGYVSNWTRDAVHFHCFGWLASVCHNGEHQCQYVSSDVSIHIVSPLQVSTVCDQWNFNRNTGFRSSSSNPDGTGMDSIWCKSSSSFGKEQEQIAVTILPSHPILMVRYPFASNSQRHKNLKLSG